MKLNLANAGQQNVITAAGEGYVQVNNTRHCTSLILSAELLVPWSVANILNLTSEHLLQVIDAKPEVLIIGTGRSFVFPSPALMRPLVDARIGHEVMDTSAACRTYNVLLSEGRRVMAALVVY